MKKPLIGLTAIMLNTTLLCSQANADAEILPVKNFKEMQQVVNKLSENSYPHTLVVMDDDDTLTMMSCPDQNKGNTCQYLGGPAWYSWQSDLLTKNDELVKKGRSLSKEQLSYLVAKNNKELLDIAALLLAVNYMDYTESEVPDVLRTLTKKGVKLLVLTARGSSNLSATTNQFSNLSVNTKGENKPVTFTDFIDSNALKGDKSGMQSIASPYFACGNSKRPVSYQQGVMYVAGQNKGEMLKCLLSSTDSSKIKNIVFIDDTLANVEDVYSAFESSSKYTVKALHYTALQAHKGALTSGPNATFYQNNAKHRWEAIKDVLQRELQTPAIPQ
ncbi:MAG: DUF2608 domain-containing protein [Gammaproteobacteria bacterium]|nr:DUF2608 domain-containing protein [Gammaproteobacteria bacterium]